MWKTISAAKAYLLSRSISRRNRRGDSSTPDDSCSFPVLSMYSCCLFGTFSAHAKLLGQNPGEDSWSGRPHGESGSAISHLSLLLLESVWSFCNPGANVFLCKANKKRTCHRLLGKNCYRGSNWWRSVRFNSIMYLFSYALPARESI